MQDGTLQGTLFFVQLGFNLAWSGLFFGLHRPGLAFIDILALLATIVATAIVFRSFSEIAFWLMVPYAMWVSFASLLNFEIWRLNPGQS
jgi:translocator protein